MKSFAYVSRSEWGARAPKTRISMRLPAPFTYIHHTAGAWHRPPTWTEKTFRKKQAEYIRQIQDFHMNTRGWSDIAYSWIVFRTVFGRTRVFEGRGWGVVGAHTEGRNSTAHAICVVGDYTKQKAGKGVIRKIRRILDVGVGNGHIAGPRKNHPTGGHQNAPGASTACPGGNLMKKLPAMRRSL